MFEDRARLACRVRRLAGHFAFYSRPGFSGSGGCFRRGCYAPRCLWHGSATRINPLVNGTTTQCIRALDKYTLDEFVIEQPLTINELVHHPRGDRIIGHRLAACYAIG